MTIGANERICARESEDAVRERERERDDSNK